ncbi:MAG: molecular chaperone HtpG [Oscillospiraceae bacterium]|jgi:molecular chaperone HtpG|nr:molecular chaperone HtpG [Oscillospiraceae bacterium]
MPKKQFKAESKRLLELMINSIYTHKEIFLRELISNASDAMDKLYYKSITENLGLSRGEFEINLIPDKEAKTLTVTDNGIGMTKEELEKNLGVIAQSGSLNFKDGMRDKDGASENPEDLTIIGQFGVGFYSAFMVSKKVVVKSKPYGGGENEAFMWTSEGADGYAIDSCAKETAGTEITLYIKDNADGERYDEFLEQYRLKNLVKKYSDYIRYPIKMETTSSRLKEETADGDKPEYEDVTEIKTLNSMIPIWKKNKSELTDEDYNNFYKDKFSDYTDPRAVIHDKTEGSATYSALMFIPKKAPFDYYTKEYEKGLQLYSSGVMIMEKCADLLPDHFSFVKGLVDSEDLSLNISREMLQHDRQLKVIAKSIDRSVRSELKKMLNNDREKYKEFWETFGAQIKFGIYNGFGANNDGLRDLLIFYSSSEKDYVTLDEYAARMKEAQDAVYYASGETIARVDSLPQVETLKDKGFEVLYLIENVDEFCMQMLGEHKEKPFRSAQSADLEIEDDSEKDEIKKINESAKDMLTVMKEALGGKVADVRAVKRLKTHPVCLTSSGALSAQMEKVLNAMPAERKAKADKVLEINSAHPIFEKLRLLYGDDKDALGIYADILYNQALLIEGMAVENPADFVSKMCGLMI